MCIKYIKAVTVVSKSLFYALQYIRKLVSTRLQKNWTKFWSHRTKTQTITHTHAHTHTHQHQQSPHTHTHTLTHPGREREDKNLNVPFKLINKVRDRE